ncbi:sodium/hydrogen exchanger 3 isoform X9 [Hermetia illucens]|uniref:sodium/hydrogen exchanger 3 isoform X9 n=1 Tax=Hermetia illucens TaxID=343691 RepID=UPI0018CC071D|nr:sodium/hydrogen exchanger 3 isoform X9 [Hermetia illucens]
MAPNADISNNAESESDLTTPALIQELNLSRRACWLNDEINREFMDRLSGNANKLTTYPSSSKPSGANVVNLNKKQIYDSVITKKYNTNSDSTWTAADPSIISNNNKNTTNNNANIDKANYCDLIEIVHRCQLHQVLCLCLRIVEWIIVSCYRNIKCSKRKNQPKLGIGFDAAKISTLLIGCLLLCANNTMARPNQSLKLTSEAEVSESSHHILTPDLAATYPGLDFIGSQNKRAAELFQTSTSEITHQAIETEQHVERYPVAQVEFQRVKTPFIIGLWILSASIAKIGFHMTPKLHRIFPESCLLIVVGAIIGVVLYFASDVEVSPLTPNTFFFYMLPPIILDAGYFMPNRLFFDNLGTILLMAVVGTIFNIATIGASLWACGLTGLFTVEIPLLDSFLFSSLISAVDPVAVLAVFEEIHVDEVLYIVVFGESLLNDAVTVVLYHMMESYNGIGIQNINVADLASGVASFFVVAIGGTIIGVIWGFLTGLVTRFTDHVRVIEPIFIFVMAYLAYLNAEIFHMSGILAITFCGITMKNYVESNISQKSHTTVKYALKMLSSSSETIIFMFLGVATINNRHVWNTWFVLLTIIFCSVFRVFGVVLLSALANRFRLHKLSKVDQFVMSYGGLRGAVAFALALLVDEAHVPLQPMFVTTTIAVIYFTVFVQGITIKPLVKLLNVKRASKRKPTMNERIHERFMDHLMAGIEDIIGKTGNFNMRDKFKRFDNRFIRPLLLRDAKGAEPKIIETYSKLTMKDAMEVLRRNPSTIGQMSGTESMSALFRNYTSTYLGGRCGTTFFNTCPSFTNLETCSRNLDMHELDYNPSKKDLTDAKIHHLLAEELKPYRRASMQMHRRLSYSRHAVDDRDLSTQVNYKMHMNIRRMVNDRKHHKRSKRSSNKQEGLKQNHVSFNDFQQQKESPKITHDYYDVVKDSNEDNINSSAAGTDDWDEDGLTFTAKSTPDSDRANNNSLIAHIASLPGFDSSKARIVQHYSSQGSSPEKLLSPDIGPTAAELILPWRRDRSYQSFAGETPMIPEEERTPHRDSECEHRVATPTAIESQLPWKRNDGENEDGGPLKQNEFPAWASNKEYLAYNSPSATFLGGLSKPKQAKSVIGLFRRESSGSGSGPIIGTGLAEAGGQDVHNRQQTNIDLPTRRNTKKGSLLELSGKVIPEESNHSKSFSEADDWIHRTLNHRECSSDTENEKELVSDSGEKVGREPLLPKPIPSPKVPNRQLNQNPLTTALLTSPNAIPNSDDEDDDDEEEDFDVYDDDHIVNASVSNRRRKDSGNQRT